MTIPYNPAHPDQGRYSSDAELMAARAARQAVRSLWRTSNAAAPRWFLIYRERIDLALEACRECGAVEEALERSVPWGKQYSGRLRLGFDHIQPVVFDGTSDMSNARILCDSCNSRKGHTIPDPWPLSLADEEAAAPPERRWSELSFIRGPRGGFETAGPAGLMIDNVEQSSER